MKKIILSVVSATIQIAAIAQTVNVHFKNGQVIEYPSENVDYVDFSVAPTPSTITAGEAVDLGLSVLWASCNLGASKPEEAGDYFSWGETQTKNLYTPESYAYFDTAKQTYISIGSEISNTEYDAAKVKLGDGWRMPTSEEMEELLNNCTWEWKEQSGKWGYVVTGKNGNTIFIPAAGKKHQAVVLYLNEGLYLWCSTQYAYSSENKMAYILSKEKYGTLQTTVHVKFNGIPIRPVKNKTN